MSNLPLDVVETAVQFSIELAPVNETVDVSIDAIEAARLARDPIEPTQAFLATMSRRWVPADQRAAWWLIQDGVRWAHHSPARPTGEVREPAELVTGQAIVAVDAVSGEQLFSGVWGR